MPVNHISQKLILQESIFVILQVTNTSLTL